MVILCHVIKENNPNTTEACYLTFNATTLLMYQASLSETLVPALTAWK
jgi:hypothetical protein